LTVAWHFKLFVYQMGVQWERLSVPNGWLASIDSAVHGMFQSLGSPEPWRPELFWASYWLWILVFAAAFFPIYALFSPRTTAQGAPRLAPAAAWVISSLWLWNSKPEVWFVYYLHEAIWCFAGVLLLFLSGSVSVSRKKSGIERVLAWGLFACTAACGILFFSINVLQAEDLGASHTWNWTAYREFIDCIDRQLTPVETAKGAPLQVWDPTFPDITVELSRRHPTWDLTRTNDFSTRWALAFQHSKDVDAVVVPEMLNWAERRIDSPMDEHPEVQSVWMNWKEYPLHHLLDETGWKLNRHLCQVGRWQAFIYIK
jgi:hypothetical protein